MKNGTDWYNENCCTLALRITSFRIFGIFLRLLFLRTHRNEIGCFFCFWHESPQRARASSFQRILDHTQRHTTVGRTPLDEWSARRRFLYLTTHITHNRQTSMTPMGFEPTFSAGERQQTYALDRAANGTRIGCFGYGRYLRDFRMWQSCCLESRQYGVQLRIII